MLYPSVVADLMTLRSYSSRIYAWKRLSSCRDVTIRSVKKSFPIERLESYLTQHASEDVALLGGEVVLFAEPYIFLIEFRLPNRRDIIHYIVLFQPG